MKIISGLLILITVFLNVRHGWGGLTMNMKPEETNMLNDLGIGKSLLLIISILTLAAAAMVLFPPTFFTGNLLNAAIILLIMAFSLKAGNIKTALIEIPFLLMPLVLIYLGHPFKK